MHHPSLGAVYVSHWRGYVLSRRRRPQDTVPRWFVVACKGRWYRVKWHPRWGAQVVSSGPAGAPHADRFFVAPEVSWDVLKRRVVTGGQGFIFPALSSESAVLVECPLLRHHLSRTAYEDGSPRKPGDLMVKNRGTAFEATVFDPDSGGKLPVLAPTLDEMFAALELLLSAPDAPWVPDRYLMEQLAKSAPKKKG